MSSPPGHEEEEKKQGKLNFSFRIKYRFKLLVAKRLSNDTELAEPQQKDDEVEILDDSSQERVLPDWMLKTVNGTQQQPPAETTATPELVDEESNEEDQAAENTSEQDDESTKQDGNGTNKVYRSHFEPMAA